MIVAEIITLVECLGETEDLRRASNGSLHDLPEILMIVVCAMLSNIGTFEDFALWAQAKEACLSRFLVLRHGIPSHATFNRLFRNLDHKQFETLFRQVVGGLVPSWLVGAKTETMGLRYYIDSRELTAERLAESIRLHWGSKNKLHRMLDIVPLRDGTTVCKDNAPQNLSWLRKIVLNLTSVGTSDTFKEHPNKKRKRAACNDGIRAATLGFKPL
jgi:hypothetical protein